MKIVRKFKCSCCGLCCKYRAPLVLPAEYIDPETGWCKFLDTDTNKCRIYESRPEICRVDEFWEKHKDELGMTRKEWHDENYMCCEELKNKYEE